MSAVKGVNDYFPKSMIDFNQSAYDFLSEVYFVRPEDLRVIMAVALSLLIHSMLFFYFQEAPLQRHVLQVEPKRMALRVYSLQASTTAVPKRPIHITKPKPKPVVDTLEKSVHPLKSKTVIQKKPKNQKKVISGKLQHTAQIPTTGSKLVAARKNQSEVARIANRQTDHNKIKPQINKVDIRSTFSATQEQSKPKIIMDPRFRHPPNPPIYPHQSIRRNQEGTTLIRAKVSRSGGIEKLMIYQSSGYALLDQAAMTAVQKWEFEPAKQNGLIVSSWVQVPVNFVLEKR